MILIEIENKLGQGSGSIINYFDWLAGTSTGAIIALALANNFTLHDCLKFYLRFKDDIFMPEKDRNSLMMHRPYSADLIEKILKEQFGEFRKLSEIKKTKNF